MSAVIQNEYTQTDSTVVRTFTFPYLKTSDIKVSLDGVETTAFTLPSATTIQLNSVPANGTKIKIFRQTSVDNLTATFYAGSAIKSEDLNDNFTQNLYKTQEVGARAISALGGTMTGDLNFGTQAQIVFEGATDDAHETTLAVTDPTADRTITLPNVTGTVITTGDTGTVATAMIAGDAVNGTKIADDSIDSEHYVDGSIDTAHIADSQVTTAKIADSGVTTAKIADNNVTTAKIAADAIDGTKIADDSINSEHYVDASIDTAHIADAQITTAKIADDAVTAAKIANTSVTAGSYTAADITVDAQGRVTAASSGVIATSEITDEAVTTAKLGADSVTGAKIADDAINSEHLAADSIDAEHYAAGSVDTTALGADAVTGAKIADDAIDSEHYTDGSIDTAHIADLNVTTAKIAADAITNAKIADDSIDSEHYVDGSIDTAHIGGSQVTDAKLASNSVITSKITDANVTTVKIADSNVTLAKLASDLKQTTISNSDTQLPTSGAVVDYVAAQIAPLGGLEVIATEVAFPNTQPQAGVVISIADAGGIVVNGSGTSTTGRTVGGSTVTINNINSAYNNTTVTAGVGFLVSSTGSGQIYNFHKSVIRDQDILSISTDINDFANRYRVHAGEPSSNNDEGDLVYDTNADKMKVYDSTTSAWKEVTSVGDFKYLFLCPAGGSGAPTLDGSIATYDLRESSNSGSAASVTSAAQLLVSINGVVQKANTGTSAPSEGFALVDSNTIVFGANLASGDSVFIVQIGSAVTINTPGDGTVSAAKITSGAVTTAKIADDAVTGGKLANDIAISTTGTISSGTITTTGDVVINSSGPKITLNDTGQNPDYDILNTDGTFQINDTTNGAVRFAVNTDGHIDLKTNVDCEAGLDVTGNITVSGTVDGIDIATDVAANTAKTSNATHTGEVTGATALTIASDVVDEDNLKVSNSPTNGYFLSAQSGNTGGLTWAAVDLTALSASNLTSGTVPDARFPATLPAASAANLTSIPAANITGTLPAIDGSNLTGVGGGITMADHWRITANFTGDANPISSNWERHDTSPMRTGNLGTGLTESSGEFTFPSTGWYYVYWQHALRYTGASAWNYMILQLDNGTGQGFSSRDYTSTEIVAHAGSSWNWLSANNQVLIDITSTNQKMRFRVDNENGSVVTMGNTDNLDTGFSIFRLGDT